MSDKHKLKDITEEIERFRRYHHAKEVLIKQSNGVPKKFENVIVQVCEDYIYIWREDDTMIQYPADRLVYIIRDEKASEMWMFMSALQYHEEMMRPIQYWIQFSERIEI